MDLNWRGKVGGSKYDTNVNAPRHGKGLTKHGQSTVRGKTMPSGDFMVGKGGGDNGVNLSVYKNRRCGHGKK